MQSAFLTCSRLSKLRLGLEACFIIRNLRFALVVCFAFFHEEYRIALVDLIVALRRTKGRGRRTLRSPPSPSSGLHLIHPGLSAAAGKCMLPRAYRDIVSLYPVLSLLTSSEFYLAVCARLCIVRVSVGLLGLYRLFFIIGGIGCLFLRLRGGFAISFVGFALTAIGSFVCADNGTG